MGYCGLLWVYVQPGQGEVMSMELQGFGVVMQVEIGITQLAVDSAEHLQVLCAHLDGSFKEGDARSVVTNLTEPLSLQS